MAHQLPLRTQVQAGQTLLALGLFLALPVSKPFLWVLDTWGDLPVPPFFWAGIFLLVGGLLIRARRPRAALGLMMMAALLMLIIGAAAWLTQGPNALTVLAAVKTLHCIWTSIDLKGTAYGRG